MTSKSHSLRRILIAASATVIAFPTFISLPSTAVAASSNSGIAMYRMYNRNSGEHFYTRNGAERDMLRTKGWKYEGVGWYAPSSGAPVYRLYNRNAGDHHYTQNGAERDCWYA